MPETSPDLTLLEPASPEALLPASGFPWWPVAAAVLLLLALAAFFILRKKRASDPARTLDEAFAQAREALLAIRASHAREAAVQASLILRGFLAKAVDDPALFETHEEFITRRDSLLTLSQPAREAGEQGFLRLAHLKYAPAVHGDPAQVVDEAGELLETFRKGLPA